MSAHISHATLSGTRHRAVPVNRLVGADVARLAAGAVVLLLAGAFFTCDATMVGYWASGHPLAATTNPVNLLGAVLSGKLAWPLASWLALIAIVAVLSAATAAVIAVMRRA